MKSLWNLMGANNLVRKRESQAGSLGFGREERIEDPLPIFRSDASPSSVTSISMARWICPPRAENDDNLAFNLIRPPLGIASLEFTTRFRTACAKSPRSPHKGGRSGSHAKLIDHGLLTKRGFESSCKSSNSDATGKTSVVMAGSAAKESR